MANFRQIHTQIWKDDWFVDLTPEEKILFVYLFSNESSTICGLYKISLRIVSFETGLNMDFIMNALAKFETDKKVVYRDNVVWMVNMRRYHASESIKIKTRIDSDEKFIPDCQLKRAYEYHKDKGKYPIDILSISYTYPDDKEEKEKEKEEQKEEEKEKDSSGTTTTNIFRLYETEIGTLSPFIAESLEDIEKDYPAGWFELAVKEAKESTTRISLKYIQAILKRWKADGLPVKVQEKKNGKKTQYEEVIVDGERYMQEVKDAS